MITEEMRAAGWRECPTDEVRKAWEAKGGRWQVWAEHMGGPGRLTSYDEAIRSVRNGAWRPVNSTTWDYCPDGWGDAVRIDRWLTEEDIEKYGNLWRWWSRGWVRGSFTSKVAMTYDGYGSTVKMCVDGESEWDDAMFGPGDYFTPARAG